MMPEYQVRFREAFNAQNPSWYNGYVNYAYIFVTWLIALWIFTQFIDDVLWWEWGALTVGFVACVFGEWFVHRNFMHRSRGDHPAMQIMYWGHDRHHHMFFTDQEMSYDSHRDWRTMFLPPYAQALCVALALAPSLLLGVIFSENAGWLFMCSVVTTYVYFETVHLLAHTDNKIVRSTPIINTIRRNHRPHHIRKHKADLNLNVTLPIFDWLMGTSDLNRSLLGHIFNGDSTEHVKKNYEEEYVKLWGAAK